MSSALDRWAEELRDRAIPEDIVAAAPESPYGFPSELFVRRAERALEPAEPTATTRRALEALPEGGTVIDVGVGGGATSLPLAGRARRITGVDAQPDMLEAFARAARAAGTEPLPVLGAWPDVAADVEPADVVACGHVFYNVQELAPFVRALTDHARSRVVVELTERHPLDWMSDLWLLFHDVQMPRGPTAGDAHEALRELGLPARREDSRLEGDRGGGFEAEGAAIALVRRRLCLTPDRDAELAAALGDRLHERDGLWSAGPGAQVVATLWWDV